jgi:hypothetical protein
MSVRSGIRKIVSTISAMSSAAIFQSSVLAQLLWPENSVATLPGMM